MIALGISLLVLAVAGFVLLLRYRASRKPSRGACGWAIAGAVLGAGAGFLGIAYLTAVLFVGSGADMGIVYVLALIGLVVGCPLGAVGGAWAALGIATLAQGPAEPADGARPGRLRPTQGPTHHASAMRTGKTGPAQGPNHRVTGAGLGLLGGALAGVPLLLLVPQWYFERMGAAATAGVVIATAVAGTVVGGVVGGAYERTVEAARKRMLMGGLICIAVLAVGTALSLGSVGGHASNVRKMAAGGDVEGLIRKLQTGGEGQSYGMRSVGTDVRTEAAQALGQSGDKRAVPALISALNTAGGGSYGLRCAAAAALGSLGDRQAVPALIEALKRTGVNGEGPEVVTIIQALGKLRDPAAVPILLERFHSFKDITHTNVNEVPEEAGKALALIGGPEIVPAVVAKLSDPDPNMRSIAARTLGKLAEARDPKALPALEKCLSNDAWAVRMYAAEGLVAGGPAAVPLLIAALKDKTPAVRKAAADSLGKIGDERAREPLRAAAKDDNAMARGAITDALRKHGW